MSFIPVQNCGHLTGDVTYKKLIPSLISDIDTKIYPNNYNYPEGNLVKHKI